MSTQEIADRLISLCREGHFDQATEELYGENIVSVEQSDPPGGGSRESAGMDAIRGKMAWWNATFEVEKVAVEGPWINEPCFIVKFIMDVKHRESGEMTHMEELALYSVHEGKIVHERFF